MNLTRGRVQEFIPTLEKMGGSSGNGSLRQALHWDEEFYWKVQGYLISEGLLATGRGKGGSVRLTQSRGFAGAGVAPNEASLATPLGVAKERDLYAPLKASIEKMDQAVRIGRRSCGRNSLAWIQRHRRNVHSTRYYRGRNSELRLPAEAARGRHLRDQARRR